MKFFFNKRSNGSAHEAEVITKSVGIAVNNQPDADAEVAAVIALAIHRYMTELRDFENTVITMQKIMKPYSPWSSKIYGLRQQPLHIPGLKRR